MLPRVSRTFAINIRLLGGSLGEVVRIGYLLCRAADALEDSWPGEPAAIRARFASLEAALGGSDDAASELARGAAVVARGRADLELVAHLPAVLHVFGSMAEPDREAVAACVHEMSAGMSHFAARAASRPSGAPYLDDERELHAYCHAVAGCVGVMLTRLFSARVPAADAGAAAARLERAPVVGEALQLTNILLDWPLDVRRGRCYVPAEWLAAHGLAPADLVGRERPGVRELAQRLEALARLALQRVPDYLALLPRRAVRYRAFCLWPAVWALGSLEHAKRDRDFPWGERRPRLPRSVLWRQAFASLVRSPAAALRGA